MATLFDLIVVLVALVILWIFVSLPVYAAAKIVTSGKATLGEAMGATLGGAIVYVIVLVTADYFLKAVIGHFAIAVAFILAFVAWLGVYRASFDTSWLGAIGIAILAAFVTIVINLILALLLGVAIPSFFHPF